MPAATRKLSEHGPQLAVREDHTPYQVHLQQEQLLGRIAELAQRRHNDAVLINELARAARQRGTSWRRISEAAGLPFKTVYDRARAGRDVVTSVAPGRRRR